MSVAVTVWLPAVRSVTVNARVPASVAVNVASAGSVAAPSVLVRRTVPR